MKKQLLSTALLTLVCSWAHADDTTVQSGTTSQALQAPAAPVAAPAASTEPAVPAPQPVINCAYSIPATTAVDQATLLTWIQKAASQTFDFTPTEIDTQMDHLKPCFTDQGWQGYRDALDNTGNLAAIKSQNLTVSSQIEGDAKVTSIKENQWKVTLPMQVVYQNDKEKLTQRLTIDFMVGRKVSGDLGIMQVIATPRDALAPAATPAPAAPDAGPK